MNIIAETNELTVISEFTPKVKKYTEYESEAKLEEKLIKQLCSQGYEYESIHSSDELLSNLRKCIEELNSYRFTDDEWNIFFNKYFNNPSYGIIEKTKLIQENPFIDYKTEDGTLINIKLIDKANIFNNKLQVINQFTEKEGKRDNRYDVTILVNGIPMVHIELKRRGILLKEAFNQIQRYQKDSFGFGTKLWEFVQIFVISNGTQTKYYSNTTRENVFKSRGSGITKKSSSSFEFTQYWADAKNRRISDIEDFTATFFSKHTILNLLIKYCVFTADDVLMVMRPYQIAATEAIINKIRLSTNLKLSPAQSGGYIWASTGSGKTLTSFKCAQLAQHISNIDKDIYKVVFVVDRKDLDYQTMKEYDRFEPGCASGNRSTKILEQQMKAPDSKIVITTIQKLSQFVKNIRELSSQEQQILNEHFVFIFDECHRSQFGEMHSLIIKAFKNFHMFGFTGTPIFGEVQSSDDINYSTIKTTDVLFGDRLHTYTIVDAVRDENVLPFKVDFIKTFDESNYIDNEKIASIDREEILCSPVRIHNIVEYIINNFDKKTFRNSSSSYYYNEIQNIDEVRKNKAADVVRKETTGFNSMLVAANIKAARKYYEEFKKQQSKLKVAMIYSFAANEDNDENSDRVDGLEGSDRDALDAAIQDYNAMFGTSWDTSSEKFPEFYKDVSLRMKNKEIDLLIVVGMFTTGADFITLNTLWVDKPLKEHGLIQAFSRTNRIFNSVKRYGNIICFRNLESEMNNAIKHFGDGKNSKVIILRTLAEYLNGYSELKDGKPKHTDGYFDCLKKLRSQFPITELKTDGLVKAADITSFIGLFNKILYLRNILHSFDEFNEDAAVVAELQDYQSIYLDVYNDFRDKEKTSVAENIVFEMELIKSVDVNIEYLLGVIESHKNDKNKIIEVITPIIHSSAELRNKQELIEEFVESINKQDNVNVVDAWIKFVKQEKEKDIRILANKYQANEELLNSILETSYIEEYLYISEKNMDKLLPPRSLFGAAGKNRQKERSEFYNEVIALFEKYLFQ